MLKIVLFLYVFLFSFNSFALQVKAKKINLELRTIKIAHIQGEIDDISATLFETEVIHTANVPGPRLVVINSPGGHVDSGERMIRVMKAEQSRGVKYVCVIVGDGASMAFNFFTLCDVRLAVKTAHFLFHKIALAKEGIPSHVRLTAQTLRRVADMLDAEDEKYRIGNAFALSLSLSVYDNLAAADIEWNTSELLNNGYLHGVATLD